jgi:DNA-binding LytR/AlgR family response regulator
MLKCLIVEDEPLAAEVLTDYISQVPFLTTAGHCTDAMKALDFLRNQPMDVMFLDLHLPGLKGFEFLKTLTNRPQVIITTAYHQYALDGFEYDVVDYLVKPIEFSRFLSAVNKLSMKSVQEKNDSQPESLRPYLFVYAGKKQVKIFPDEIIYVESEKDYLKIVSKEKSVVIRQTMRGFEKQLTSNSFIRVHRSFLVNSIAITAYDSMKVEAGGKPIPIGRLYREDVLNKLKSPFYRVNDKR